jgi:2-dehydro-3-deoxygalactonokinase
MTGELFQVLQRSSILTHSVEPSAGPGDPGNPFFERGVRRAAHEGLLESLFTVRAGALLDGIDRGSSSHYLSGLLIGSEAASIVRRHAALRPIVVGGSASLQALYLRAFDLLGAGPRVHAVPEEVTSLAATLGHWSLRAQLERRRAPS